MGTAAPFIAPQCDIFKDSMFSQGKSLILLIARHLQWLPRHCCEVIIPRKHEKIKEPTIANALRTRISGAFYLLFNSATAIRCRIKYAESILKNNRAAASE